MKIAFGSKMGVGKDEAYRYINSKTGSVKNIKFADSIYNILHYAQHICKFDKEKDRQFLQIVGDWARNKDPSVWINLAMAEQKNNEHCIITDLRYKNEFNALKQDGWILVKIIRNTIENNRTGNGCLTHSSENDLDDIDNKQWDYIIYNNNSLDEFHNKLNNLISNHI